MHRARTRGVIALADQLSRVSVTGSHVALNRMSCVAFSTQTRTFDGKVMAAEALGTGAATSAVHSAATAIEILVKLEVFII